MRIRISTVVLVVVVVSSGCGALGGSVGRNDWTVVGVTPDDQHVLVTTLFGGVASGCTRWEGWEVDESASRVEVEALLWRQRFPGGCTDEGITETIEIDLVEPLGDRDLIGCGAEDCRTGDFPPWSGSWRFDAAVTQTGAVVANSGSVWSFGADGDSRWASEGEGTGRLESFGDVAVVYDGRDTTAYDAQTGTELWQTTGILAAAGDDVMLVCRGDDAGIVAAVDTTTGTERWSVDLPCDFVVFHDDVVMIVAGERTVDGGYELFLVDPATGALLLRKGFDDGVDDKVTGFDGAIMAGDRFVVSGVQADLVVLGLDGQELLRRPNGIGEPLGAVAGLVIMAAHDRIAAVDPITGETVWASQEDTRASLRVSGDALWSLDAPAGNVSRLDALTGQPLWTAPVGRTSGFDVAASQTIAYVTTSLAVVALDAATGKLLWWLHLPYHQP